MNNNESSTFSDFKKKFTAKNILLVIAGILVLIVLFSSWFTIEPEEVGVVLRFGKFERTVNPGLNFKLPFGIEDSYKVPVERQLKMEFGFRTIQAGINTSYSNKDYLNESLMLTGDLNAAEVEWIVQYRISDPYKYLFQVRNAESTFRDINEAVMREIVGDRAVNEVLTIGRQEIANTVQIKVQQLCDEYITGIKVEQIVLQDVNPPESVKPSFNEVNEAQQEKEKMINQAKSEYNRVIPKAKGEAEQTIEEATGYALERINNAKGEAVRFTALFNEYIKAEKVTKTRLYLEIMDKVLNNVGRKIITDKNASGILPLFQVNNLNKELINE
ncbi:MAG: FtsH protease activity modulator HflK [Spirochaetales bacterium]|nr:FtsH protease activity modulator HflK [Spirochaetales bacterium]